MFVTAKIYLVNCIWVSFSWVEMVWLVLVWFCRFVYIYMLVIKAINARFGHAFHAQSFDVGFIFVVNFMFEGIFIFEVGHNPDRHNPERR